MPLNFQEMLHSVDREYLLQKNTDQSHAYVNMCIRCRNITMPHDQVSSSTITAYFITDQAAHLARHDKTLKHLFMC